MRIQYKTHTFTKASRAVISIADSIISEYAQQGFTLTLRQLYYQLVARDYLPNTQRDYKRLGNIISEARLAGHIDWNAIIDRTRSLRAVPHFSGPQEILTTAASSFHIDMWEKQKYRPEVWIEKDALIGVIAGVCSELDVPFFACRGYVSQSEMWSAGYERLRVEYLGVDPDTLMQKHPHHPIIFHLGDHDPSGMDMTRDITDRIELLSGTVRGSHFSVIRLALNWDQIQQYSPPPNPAKLTDTRAKGYIDEYGSDSWELDALEPTVIVNLIRDSVTKLIDQEQWDEDMAHVQHVQKILHRVADNYNYVEDMINELGEDNE